VEDDDRLAELVGEYLREQGFSVSRHATGSGAVARVLADQPQLVLLDVMLPGESGLSVCQALRAQDYTGAILMMTARRDDIDEVLGLDMGADDYVGKPVRPRVLLARVTALLRRSSRAGLAAGAVDRVVEGDLVADRLARRATLAGEDLQLTTAEFDLLWVFVTHPGRPITRQELFQELRGIDYDGLDRSMDVRVSQLRKKVFQDRGVPDRIVTVRGTGYQFVPAGAP
jgi:DNA-binding response OmpR family regulator